MKYDICVVGGCSIDQIYFMDKNGNYPKKPNIINFGGKASNQAIAASRAGSEVVIISRLGKDKIGKLIYDNLINNNVSVKGIEIIENLKNDMANIYIDKNSKDNIIERVTNTIDSFDVSMIKKFKDILLNSKIVVAQMKAPKEFDASLINFCYENNIPIVITPCNPEKLSIIEKSNKELIDKIYLITCNEKECMNIFKNNNIEDVLKEYPNKLIVTLGNRGVIYNNGKRNVHIPSPKVDKVEDTTGAGDTFNGNLISSLLQGDNLHDSIIKAQFASSMKIRIKSAQKGMPYKDELKKYIDMYEKLNDIKK